MLVVPVLWALLGLSAALQLGMAQDAGLLLDALAGTALLAHRDWRRAPVAA